MKKNGLSELTFQSWHWML